jgi:tetratricopeptide (TPR) repeat protein
VPSEATPYEPETTPEEYRQRALLLADLGRYDEAAGEVAAGLASAPADAPLLITLARVHLAAEQPAEALVAAERASSAAPYDIGTLVVRGMALVDNRRYAEAAQTAGAILGRWPDDPYALRTGAALLSEARNGQEALNAAWAGVRTAPADAESHLVLALVAARLRLFDLAQRAYAESLQLNNEIGEAQRDVGVIRLERRRWARALEALADEAALATPDDDEPTPSRPLEVVPPGPVLDQTRASAAAIRQAVLFGANSVLVTAVLAGVMTLASSGVSRVWAAVIAVVIVLGLRIWLGRRVPEALPVAVARVRQEERRTMIIAVGFLLAPLLLIAYGLTGSLIPLVSAMVLAAVAEVAVLTYREPGLRPPRE